MQAREQFLKNIIELEKYLRETQIAFNNNELQREIFELFYNMRLLTINVVECIKKWKESFVYMSSFLPSTVTFDTTTVEFCFGNYNYLRKLSSDMNFLYGSSLSRIISFSNRSDPFLLTPSIYKKKVSTSSGRVDPQQIIVITLHPELKVRIQLCQRFITAELSNNNKSRTNDHELQPLTVNDPKKPEFHTAEDTYHRTDDHIRSRSKMEIDAEQIKSNPIEKEPDNCSIAPLPTSNKQLYKDSSEVQVIEITNNEKNNVEEAEIIEHAPHKESEEQAVIWESKKDNFVIPDVFSISNGKNISDSNIIKQCGLFPIQLTMTDFKRFYEDYMSDLDDRFKKSFEEYDDIKEMAQHGHESYFIQYKSLNISTPNGLLIMYGDATCQTHRRVIISHISTKSMKDIVLFAHKAVSFIWENLPYKEIRIGLKHFLSPQNQLQTDPDITNLFINELKFRWKTLINNDNTKRITYFGLNKPEGISAVREYPSNGFLFVRSYVVLLINGSANDSKSNSNNSKYSVIPYLHCLKELVQNANVCTLPSFIKSMLSTTIESVYY